MRVKERTTPGTHLGERKAATPRSRPIRAVGSGERSPNVGARARARLVPPPLASTRVAALV
eukprot:4994459-Prymnesium_polylepis.1